MAKPPFWETELREDKHLSFLKATVQVANLLM